MTRRLLRIATLLAWVLSAGRFAAAHDGPHKIMGTVTVVDAHRIDVTTTEHKSVSVIANDKTKVTHGTMVMKVSDLKPGDRIVITALEKKDAAGKITLTASQIRLGVSAPKPKKQRDPRPALLSWP